MQTTLNHSTKLGLKHSETKAEPMALATGYRPTMSVLISPEASAYGSRKLRFSFAQGLSLLEVMLALSILGVSTAILAQILQIGTDNGLRARRITQAQMLCESKMNEVVLGSVSTQTTSWTPITIGVANSDWFFLVETIAAEQPSLIGVVVSVSDSQAISENRPPLARLVQWIIDPSLGMDSKTTTDPASTDSSSGSSSSTNAAGGGI
jgi:prepilin-type N-terminal cleavage/methylation domain-containing protein